jgi:hypothetical protein
VRRPLKIDGGHVPPSILLRSRLTSPTPKGYS